MPTLLSHTRRILTAVLALGAAALIVLALAIPASRAASSAKRSHPDRKLVNVYPVPGDTVAPPHTQITFRGIPVRDFGKITVTGSRTGAHHGRVRADSDGRGGSFLPRRAFKPGETVTVRTHLRIFDGHDGTFRFTVADAAGHIAPGASPLPIAKPVAGSVWRFVTRPDLTAPAVTVNHLPQKAQPGGIFVAPEDGPIHNGVELLGPYGGLEYFKPAPSGDTDTDFREQAYDGRPALTWWVGKVSAAGIGRGVDEIYNEHYQHVATVRAGNGLHADLHEFDIIGRHTALITAAFPVYMNTSSVKGGRRRQAVFESVVQEIDIPTGLVLAEWDSLDHVPISDSYVPPTKPGHPWDYFHINSIQSLQNGTSLLISSRNDWAVYKVSTRTGKIEWTLGGKHSSFRMGPNTQFVFQHDPRLIAGNEMTIFDDGAGPPIVHKESRALTLRLNMRARTATLASQDEHSPPLLAVFEGSVERLANGDDFVGWGQQPYFTEFNSAGKVVFDAHFVAATSSYRAYRFAWSGTPLTTPAVAVRESAGQPVVYVSWNGATGVARWRVLGGPTTKKLGYVASNNRTGFETSIGIPHSYRYIEVEALSPLRHVLRISKPIRG